MKLIIFLLLAFLPSDPVWSDDSLEYLESPLVRINSHGTAFVRSADTSRLTVEVSNLLGQVVYSASIGSLRAGVHTIELARIPLPVGIYLLRVGASRGATLKLYFRLR